MHLRHLASLCLFLLLGLPPLSAANVPLTLTASADQDVLLARRLQYFKGLENSPKFAVDSAKVTLTFTNTGDEPLTLNTYTLTDDRLQLAMSGPDGGSVVQQQYRARNMRVPPNETDYPVLPPGGHWTMTMPLSFPDGQVGGFHYLLRQTGSYHLRFLYTFAPNKAELASEDPRIHASFQGAVASNMLTLTLVEAGEPVHGVQMALEARPSPDPLSRGITFIGYTRNVSDQPIIIHSWDLLEDGLQLTDKDGKVIDCSSPAKGVREVTPSERFTTLAPGETHAFPLQGEYYPSLDNQNRQTGQFSVKVSTGTYRSWRLQDSMLHASAVLDMPDAPVEQMTGAPGALWVGKATSPAILIPLNPTAYRQAKLRQENTHFALQLNYTGPQNELYLSMHFNEKISASLLHFLAQSGVLRDAMPPGRLSTPPERLTGYSMVFAGSPDNGPQVVYWSHFLGWNLDMYRQLQALQAQLPKDEQEGMGILLTRLKDLHDQWEAEDALRQPAVTLDTPAGTLGDAANTIIAALHLPAVKLMIDTFTAATPTR